MRLRRIVLTRAWERSIMEKQRILVTGGAGFIGTNLVVELRTRGHDVHSIDLSHIDREAFTEDVQSYRQLENLFDDHVFDYVYNLAAEYGRWNGEDHYENLWATNCIGTKHVLRLQERKGSGRKWRSKWGAHDSHCGPTVSITEPKADLTSC
jgi:nucleoside-diphosphate-sugar epimerase